MQLLNQHLIYGSGDGALRSVNLKTGKVVDSCEFKKGIRCLALSPDRKQLAVGLVNGLIHVLDLDGWTPSALLSGHQFGVRDMVWTTDKILVSAGDDMTISFWKDAKELKRLTGHTSQISALSWHPKKRILYSGGYDKTIIRWSEDGKALNRANGSGVIRRIITGPERAPVILGCRNGKIHILESL